MKLQFGKRPKMHQTDVLNSHMMYNYQNRVKLQKEKGAKTSQFPWRQESKEHLKIESIANMKINGKV